MSKGGQKLIAAAQEAVAIAKGDAMPARVHLSAKGLIEFQEESNRIEGIFGVRKGEVEALCTLLASPYLWIPELAAYVATCQPNAVLRESSDVPGVRVGNHVAPPSGPKLMTDLCILLDKAHQGIITPHAAHIEYETLHPFTEGNGRSGRALWLWVRNGHAPLGFLHQFYYDTLAATR